MASDTAAITTLQQDVIYAKNKQTTYTEKMEAMESAFESQRSVFLQREAQKMVDDLTRQGYSSTQKELKFEEVAKETKAASLPTKPQPKSSGVSVEDDSEKAPLPIRLVKFFIKPSDNKTNLFNQPKYNKKPTEGELLYKVAISDGKVTLREAVEIGVANNAAIKAARKKVEVAQAKLVEAKRALFPTAQANWSTDGGVLQRFYKGENRQLKLSQPIYYGGELVLTVKQAEENIKASKMEYEKIKNEYIHNARTAYYGVVKAEYNSQYQRDLYRKVLEVYKKIREEHNQRLISEVDFLNVESQYQQVYFQVDSAHNDLASAHVLFHQTINLDSATDLPVDLELKFNKISPLFDDLYRLALENNPDVLSKEYALTSAKVGVDVFKAKKLPHVDLRGSYGYEGEVYHDTQAFDESKASNDLEREWYLGVHASMPLGPNSIEYDQIKHQWGPTVSAYQGSVDWTHKGTFNLFDKFSEITDEKSAEAAFLQSQSDLEKARYDLHMKLRDDFYNLQKSLIQIDASIAKIRYQEKQNAISEYLLSMQEVSAGNFFEGLIEYAQSKFAFIQAVVDYHLAVSSLSVSVGDPDYFDRTNVKS